METKFTPGPWVVGQYSDTMGYDCMTGGVRVGPVVLDGADYGQKPCADLHIDDHFRMMADAHLIAAAPDLYAALEWVRDNLHAHPENTAKVVAAALAKARGEA